jgi:hypothetical protein
MGYLNHEGYPDPTAHYGIKEVVKEESEQERRIRHLMHIIREAAHLAGFEVVGRITFKDKKTGREFR